ncbi:hypothetical protein [Parathalassolituus penaei]|uniref:DUF115 domain-containing protein n=1 Tax=Parathalassolituus penaei TaxID=2997323 RepID=A0A9X3EFY8_9GAMM|nr:hypothetical protein [Parathalassolituus penaei]MCY0966837.1 hypothetical protein [Parathalassolituus penaei]
MFTKHSNIVELKNICKGKKGVIIANGPSALQAGLNDLGDAVVIGMNASWLLRDQYSRLKFDYYCFSDVRFLQSEKKRMCFDSVVNSGVRTFLRAEFKDLSVVDPGANVDFIKSLGKTGFSKDIREGFFFGNSTTVMALQVAYYLGLDEVCLVGVDMQYSQNQARFYSESEVQLEDSTLSSQMHNIILAKKVFEEAGRKIYISSARSLLRPYFEFKLV